MTQSTMPRICFRAESFCQTASTTFLTAASMRDARTKYQAHVAAMLKLAGFTDTDARAKRIFDLEHAIAEKHTTLAENDDIHKANNTWKQADFAAKAPGLEWAEYSAEQAEPANGIHRVAADGVYRRSRVGGFSFAGNVEGLAGLSPDRRLCRCIAQGARR